MYIRCGTKVIPCNVKSYCAFAWKEHTVNSTVAAKAKLILKYLLVMIDCWSVDSQLLVWLVVLKVVDVGGFGF